MSYRKKVVYGTFCYACIVFRNQVLSSDAPGHPNFYEIRQNYLVQLINQNKHKVRKEKYDTAKKLCIVHSIMRP